MFRPRLDGVGALTFPPMSLARVWAAAALRELCTLHAELDDAGRALPYLQAYLADELDRVDERRTRWVELFGRRKSLLETERAAGQLRRQAYEDPLTHLMLSVDGQRAADVRFENVRVTRADLLGEPGQGAAILDAALDYGAGLLCAEALGAMEAAKEATLDYLRTRKQFGVPIGSFQALQHRMADLLLEIEQARSAVINAAAALDGERIVRERALSAAKASIGRIGTLVAEECIQLHGGIGMTWELPLAHYAKRLVMIDHQLGDEDHHLERYIALGRELEAQAA